MKGLLKASFIFIVVFLFTAISQVTRVDAFVESTYCPRGYKWSLLQGFGYTCKPSSSSFCSIVTGSSVVKKKIAGSWVCGGSNRDCCEWGNNCCTGVAGLCPADKSWVESDVASEGCTPSSKQPKVPNISNQSKFAEAIERGYTINPGSVVPGITKIFCPAGKCRIKDGGNFICLDIGENVDPTSCYYEAGDDQNGNTILEIGVSGECITKPIAECNQNPPNPKGTTDITPDTCHRICKGEGSEASGNFVPNDQYKNCCNCVCGNSPYGSGSCNDDPIFYEDNNTGNIWTELGCIEPTQAGVVVFIMRIFFGIATGVAILRFIQAGYMLNTDEPEKIKEGKSIAVSAFIAIIFAAMLPILLNFIGIDILGIGQIVGLI